MTPRLNALSVHLLTATGAVLSMLAMLAAVDGKWSLMFLWLVVALVIDGIDGPLARRYDVKSNWPTYDGVLMDLIVDYLTYVFIPAFALFKSGLLTGWTGWLAIIAIVYGSVVYFADTRMKTKDYSFAGFPACWNMVVLVLFATIILSYFDCRRATMWIYVFYFVANTLLTLVFMQQGYAFYGYGFFLASALTFLVAATVLFAHVRKLPYHAFITNNNSVKLPHMDPTSDHFAQKDGNTMGVDRTSVLNA